MSEESPNSPAAPFNAAIDCLMRLSKLIQDIRKVSTEYTLYTDIIGIRLNAGQAQHIKHRLVKQLIVQAIPLLTDDSRKSLWDRIQKIKPKIKETMNSKTGKDSNVYEVFDEGIENKLDDIVFRVQSDLQEKGKFFMPPRKDPMRAVLQR